MTRAALFAVALLLPLGAHAENLSGQWRGAYVCTQGVTALTLTIADGAHTQAPHEITARFDFGPIGENSAIPSGSFQMVGVHTPDDQGREVIELRGVSWLDQPPGYVMVDLRGGYLAEQRGEFIGGAVLAQATTAPCTEFVVRRQPPAVG